MPRRENYRGRKVLFPLGLLLLATAGLALTAGLNRWLVFLVGVGVLIWLAFAHPFIAIAMVVLLLALAAWLIPKLWRAVRRLFAKLGAVRPQPRHG